MKLLVTIFLSTIFFFSISFASDQPKFITTQMAINMVYGKSNKDVIVLQKMLFQFGYYQSEEVNPNFTGMFDSDLKISLIEFQKTNDINPTGQVDKNTVDTLNQFSKLDPEVVEEDNQNQFIGIDNTLDKYNEEFSYQNKGILDYYKTVPVLGTIVAKALNYLYPVNISSTQTKFDIFDCLADPKCLYAN